MATSREVYNRIRWDARFDRRRFVIGYRERHEDALVEVPFDEWDGTIPWHRVHYFAAEGKRVWDRATGLDAVSSGDMLVREDEDALVTDGNQAEQTDASRARADRDELAPGFERIPAFQWTGSSWDAVSRERLRDGTASVPLRVVTWNVMAERHGDTSYAITRLEPRLPGLLATLRDADADVIALQEVTPAFLDALLAQAWVRGHYTASHAVAPPGVAAPLLLARTGFEVGERVFSNQKRALVARLRVGDEPLHVAVVHLTSDLARDAAEKRARELEAVGSALAALGGSALLLGDFNATVEDPGDLGRAGFVDAWRVLRPGERGATFDPSANGLAAKTSVRGLPFRLDRALLRSRTLEAVSIDRLGGGGEAATSDHFGLSLRIEGLRHLDAEPTTASALAVLLPESADTRALEALRRAHDPAFERWPPHVNLLFGFVAEDAFEDAALLLASALADDAPFTVRFERFEVFEHETSATVHLVPESDGALEQLQERVAACAPRCDRRLVQRGRPFVPHLTVGRFESAALAREHAARFARDWQPLEVAISGVALLLRGEGGRLTERARVPFGRSLEGWLSRTSVTEAPAERARRESARAWLDEALRAAGHTTKVHVAGSTRLGVATSASDLDLVVVTWELSLEDLARVVEARGVKAQLVLGALFPLVRFELEDLVVEAHVDGEAQDLPDRCREIDRLLELAGERVTVASYRIVLRAVRAWARARSLDSQAWGFLANAAWALLVGWSVEGARRDETPEALLLRFFARAAAHPWPEPVSPEPGAPAGGADFEPEQRDRFPVLGLVAPIVNVARAVTPGTREVLLAELRRGVAVTERVLAGVSPWDELVEPATPSPQAHVIELRVEPRSDDAGELERGAVRFLLELERERGVTGVRAFPRRDGSVLVAYSGPEQAVAGPLARLTAPRRE